MPNVEMTEEHQTRLEDELKWFARAEEEHKLYEARWDHQDVLYFGHKRFVEAYTDASARVTVTGSWATAGRSSARSCTSRTSSRRSTRSRRGR
jgi:hypothetical protein